MDRTLALIGRAHQGDKAARDLLFEENTGLIYSVAKRFLGRGVEMEDLFQIGSIGLLKAVDKFDMSYDVKFSTYAVPMIIGEIKRYLRDDGILKVSRSLKENHYRIYQVREALTRRLEREPTTGEMAAEMGISIEELVMTMESGAEVESLHKTIYQGEGTEISLMDKLPEKENLQEKALNRIFLEAQQTFVGASWCGTRRKYEVGFVFPKAVIEGASSIIPAIAFRAVSDKIPSFNI